MRPADQPSIRGASERGGSARQEAEAEQLLLAAVVASSQDAILTKTMDGIITSWNAGAERLYGYSAGDVVGKSVTLLIPPDQPDEFPSIMSRLRRGERVEPYETVRRHKDGRRVDVFLTVSPLVALDGTILGASAVARDIGERKRLDAIRQLQEAALRESEEKYRSLFNAISQGFCILEVIEDAARRPIDLRYLEVNPAFEGQTGLRDAAGKTATELFGGVEDVWLQAVANVSRSGESVRLEDSVAALGRWFDVHFFRTSGPRRANVAAIFTDVTERKQFEAEREAFAAAMTHDLKSPLSTVHGMTQLLHRRAQRAGMLTVEQIGQALAPIQAATDRMTTMLNELLDVTRAQQGHALDLQLEDCDLVALCREIIAEQQALTTRHRLALDTRLTSLVGRWDRMRLERVLRNLLANAMTYSPDGGEVLVSLKFDAVTGAAQLVITDHGIGIPDDDLRDLFRAFRRGRNVVERIPGSGIGLMSVKQVVEQHGGTVAVTSREGYGSTFTVRLPLNPMAPQSA